MQNPWRPEKHVVSLGPGVTDKCEPSCRCWECSNILWKVITVLHQVHYSFTHVHKNVHVWSLLDDIVSVDFTVCQLYLKSLVIKYHYKTQQKLKRIKSEGANIYPKLQIAIDKAFQEHLYQRIRMPSWIFKIVPRVSRFLRYILHYEWMRGEETFIFTAGWTPCKKVKAPQAGSNKGFLHFLFGKIHPPNVAT